MGNNKCLFMKPVLAWLGDGRRFASVIAWTLRAAAGLIVLFSLVTFFRVGRVTFRLTAEGMVGGTVFEGFFVAAVYGVTHVLLIRAREIERLVPGELYALPIGAVLVKLLGELYAAFVIPTSIGGGIFIWFTDRGLGGLLGTSLRALLPGKPAEANFLGGVEIMIGGLLASAAALVVCYAFSEMLRLRVRRAEKEPAPQAAGNPGEDTPGEAVDSYLDLGQSRFYDRSAHR